MVRQEDWARGYALQARSDLDARVVLLSAKLPDCHQLHYLQMVCEKLCKARLYRLGQGAPAVQTSHNYIATVLPIIVRETYLDAFGNTPRHRSQLMKHARHLAREINFLAPAVDDGGRRQDNCEYPWETAERVIAPAEAEFPNLDLLSQPNGRLLLKLLRMAIESLCDRNP